MEILFKHCDSRSLLKRAQCYVVCRMAPGLTRTPPHQPANSRLPNRSACARLLFRSAWIAAPGCYTALTRSTSTRLYPNTQLLQIIPDTEHEKQRKYGVCGWFRKLNMSNKRNGPIDFLLGYHWCSVVYMEPYETVFCILLFFTFYHDGNL